MAVDHDHPIGPDPMARVCWSCGQHYNLHVCTVCPRCWAWPRKPEDRKNA